MTVEELKKIANEMGYNIIKKQEYVKLLPCKCGGKVELWSCNCPSGWFYWCSECDAKGGLASTERQARINWNRMVSE